MTDALTYIEQTEPRVLPEARAFVLTTLDDVQQLRARAERLTEAECRALLLLHAAQLKAEFAARSRPVVEVHPNWSSD